jgi:hypothetical protein
MNPYISVIIKKTRIPGELNPAVFGIAAEYNTAVNYNKIGFVQNLNP